MNIPSTEKWNFTDVKFLPIFKEYAIRDQKTESLYSVELEDVCLHPSLDRFDTPEYPTVV